MKRLHLRDRVWRVGAAACALALAGCGGGGGGSEATEGQAAAPSAAGPSATALALGASPQGRLLASNCFQCHGTNGTGGFEEIRGKSAEDLIEFLGKPASSNIMAAHAQGYTTEQLSQIAAYLSR